MDSKDRTATWTADDIRAPAELLGEKSQRATRKEFVPSANAGQKPKLHWLPKERLFIPPEFQRLVKPGHVGMILSKFDYGFLHGVHVGPEEKEGFPIIDGQHQWLAAMRHPEVDELPVLEAWWATTKKQQAEIFVRLNFNRVNISPTGIFYANVAMEDEETLWITDVLEEAGCKMSRVMTGNMPPLTTCAIGSFRKLRTLDKPLRKALDLMAKAWPTQVGAFQGAMIEAVTKFVALHGTRTDFDRLRITLAKMSSAEVVSQARRMGKELEQPAWEWLLNLLHKRYNEKLHEANQLPRTEWRRGMGA